MCYVLCSDTQATCIVNYPSIAGNQWVEIYTFQASWLRIWQRSKVGLVKTIAFY